MLLAIRFYNVDYSERGFSGIKWNSYYDDQKDDHSQVDIAQEIWIPGLPNTQKNGLK
jgi:hypothetical protein